MKKSNGLVKQKYSGNRVCIKKIQAMFVMGLAALFFAGCSDGGSGSGMNGDGPGSGNPASVMQGVFVDSPVQGLDYMTPTHTGITDEEGRFTCFEGEMITFMIGDVTLGQAMANEIMTPLDFLDGSETPFDITHPMVTNMGRFLQSLDADGDPENGITLSEEVRAEITGRMIDFRQSVEGFENDPDVEACFDVFNALDMPHNGMRWELFATEEVRQHMNEHMGQYMGYHRGYDSPEGSDDGFEHPMENFTDSEMGEFMEDHMGFDSPEDPDGQFKHPMDGFTDDEMVGYMNDRMGFGSSDDNPENEFEHPMNEYMDDEMFEYMNDHMGFGSPEETDGEFEHPMENFTNSEMGEYMEDHMGLNPSDDPESEFEHPMNEYMDDEMFEYMNDHMGYGDSETNKTGYPMGQYRGNHM